jgi:hypothetical protein
VTVSRSFFPILGLSALLLAACSSDSGGSAPGVPPSGVFVRTDADGQPVRLAFDSGRGARVATTQAAQGEIVERTCFSYQSGSAIKATLKKKIVAGKGVSTEQDLAGRIVETQVAMSGDGSKLDSNAFLEEGRFAYERDGATSAADVLGNCP